MTKAIISTRVNRQRYILRRNKTYCEKIENAVYTVEAAYNGTGYNDIAYNNT